jgi:O-antigen/teichoic acid export membrane protein
MSTATQISIVEESAPVLVPELDAVEFHRRIGRISRQSGAYFAGTIFTAAAGCFFKVYLARKLGAEALGLYALGMSMVAFLGLFNAVGLPTAAARFVAEYSARGDMVRLGAFLRGGIGLLSVANLLLGAAMLVAGPWVAVHFYHAPALSPYLWAFALLMLFSVLSTFLGQVMAGYGDVARRTVITHFIGTPATMGFAVLLISLGVGLSGYMAAQVVSALLMLVLMAIAVWRMTPADAHWRGRVVRIEKQVASFSAAAFGLAAMDFALSQTDKIVLGYYLPPKQVGIYAVAMALVAFVPIALLSVNQIFSPMIAELHAVSSQILLQRLYATLTKWIVILTIPLALTIVVFARSLMGIFGPAFEPGATVLAIGALGQLINCAVGSVGFLLLMSGQQMQVVKIQSVNAGLMIGLSLFMVPRWGMMGAALASAIIVATTNLWSLIAVRRTLKMFPYHTGYFKLALPAVVTTGILAAMTRVSWIAYSHWRMVGLALICAYGVFLGTLLLFGLDGEDRQIGQIVWMRIRQTLGRNGVNA